MALKEAGVKRRFVGLKIDGPAFARPAENRFDVMYNGAFAGYVSAAAFSPRIGSNIALAMVSTTAIDGGAEVDVITGEGVRNANIVDLPFSQIGLARTTQTSFVSRVNSRPKRQKAAQTGRPQNLLIKGVIILPGVIWPKCGLHKTGYVIRRRRGRQPPFFRCAVLPVHMLLLPFIEAI